MSKSRFFSKVVCLLLTVTMLTTLAAGCGGTVKNSNSGNAGNTGNAGNAGNTGNTETKSTPKSSSVTYPIVDKPITLTMWATLRKASESMDNFNQKSSFQEMEKATGIHIEFLHPAGNATDNFNLMVASNNLPDIIWKKPTEAIVNNFIVILNDLIQYAPDYKKVLDQYPNVKKAMYTDDGKLNGFGYILPYLEQNIISGTMIRKDWLDKLGLKIPQTISDWEKVLTEFKDKDPNGNGKADEIPFDGEKNKAIMNLAMAWGVKNDFYIEGGPEGKVKYGPMEPAFKEFIIKMNDWFKKGLINTNYLKTDAKMAQSNMTGNIAGATYGGIGGQLGTYTGLMLDNPEFLLWPTPLPKLTDNSKIYGDLARGWSLSAVDVGYITTANKYPVETVKWFNWGYSNEGNMAFNFGKEGVSYKMVNGTPVFTDEVLKNPKGLPVPSALSFFAMSADEHAFVQRIEVVEQTSVATPAQRQAIREWGKGCTDSPEQNLMLPPITLTSQEESEDNKRLSDINSYKNSMLDKFITGEEPIANYDVFIKKMKDMGIEESIKIRQAALGRWLTRGNVKFDPKYDRAKLNFKNSKLITEKGLQFLDSDLK